jgi:hypothetical protein
VLDDESDHQRLRFRRRHSDPKSGPLRGGIRRHRGTLPSVLPDHDEGHRGVRRG